MAGERGAAAARRRRRRRRRQQWVLGLLAVVTTLALLTIAGFVKEIAKTSTVASPAALTATAHSTRQATPSPSPRRPPPSAGSANVTEINDGSSGLSYRLLASPWRRGCPAALNTPMFSWTAGESAVAGRVDIDGTATDWYGNACSGRLSQQFTYSGSVDLEPVTMGLAGALDPAYYSGLRHYRTIEGSSAIRVSGHPAWVVTFLMTYPDAASQGLAWTSEVGAAVVVDLGPDRAPAVFYASVPSNLGTSNVGALVTSLRLSR